MPTFRLPDLGEGLAEAEILAWHVQPGDIVQADQPMVSVETAKAVVEVPVPFTGTVTALHGAVGDIISTGAPLIDFDSGTVVGTMPRAQDGEGIDAALPAPPSPRADGTACGETARAARRRALPLARGVARHLGVDLESIEGSGPDGAIRLDDVLASARALASAPALAVAPAPASAPAARPSPAVLAEPPGAVAEPLRGARRAMAQSMSLSRDEIPLSTVCDDADVHAWSAPGDFTLRLLRALKSACAAEPALNAWYDAARQTRLLMRQIDVAIAVDTPSGLIVPVVRHIERKTQEELRAEVAAQKQAAHERRTPPEDLRGFTLMLSNFGTLAGRYGIPIVVPPAVAILGAGKVREDAVAVAGCLAVRRRMPLSLSFDHRCITGGEACRFLAAVIADLERAD